MKTHIFFVLAVLKLGHVSSQCLIAHACVTDLSECRPGYTLLSNSSVNGCCPGCVEGDIVIPGCNPPFSCLSDGRYAPVQCKGDIFHGRCFCSDEQGNRIFGQMWRDQAQEMSCACSRRRAELEASGRNDVTLHCTATGDYETLQCDSGLCWCANQKTGQPTIPPLPEKDFKLLPCYSVTSIGEQYLRKCESVMFALNAIRKEQSEHGTNFWGGLTNVCQCDGSFGPYDILNNIARCVGRDGSPLGSWAQQIEVTTNLALMDCNCARDTMIYFPERGMTVTETCEANGNYKTEQIAGDITYCVDSDGYQISCPVIT